MSPGPTPHDVQFLATTTELRDWFDRNHATAVELWLGYFKVSSGRAGLTWSQAVDEALCVGWNGGVRFSLDAATHAQRFTPRRKGSTWSAINVAKVAALTAQGRVRPAGLAALEARTASNTAIYSYEREAAAISDEEIARFQGDGAAWADWERRPPSYRKAATHWVTDAKQAATRERRLTTLIDDHAAGRKPRALTPPGER